MACARRRIGPEARVRTFRESGHQRVVADADERAAEIADVGTREPQTGLLILNLLPSGAAVGDDDRRAAPWLRAPSAAGLRTRARERPARGRRGSPRARRRRIATRAAAPRDISPARRGGTVADIDRHDAGAPGGLRKQQRPLLGRDTSDKDDVALRRRRLRPEVRHVDRIGDEMQPTSRRQQLANDIHLKPRDRDVVGEKPAADAQYRAPASAGHCARACVRSSGNRMRCPAGGRKRFQAARVAALVIVEAAVRAEEKIFVDCIDRRQTGPRDRHRNRGRQRLRPAMHVDDRALCRQTAEQPRELVRCWPVPSPLHCCGEPRRIAEKVALA